MVPSHDACRLSHHITLLTQISSATDDISEPLWGGDRYHSQVAALTYSYDLLVSHHGRWVFARTLGRRYSLSSLGRTVVYISYLGADDETLGLG